MTRFPSTALWAVFTVVAVASGLGAVAVVQGAVTGAASAPLSRAEVTTQLAAVSTAQHGSQRPGGGGAGPTSRPSARPDTGQPSGGSVGTSGSSGGGTTVVRPSSDGSQSPAPSTQPARTDVTRTLASRGGSVVATCQGATVYLRSWSPSDGFVVHEVHRGPAAEAEITFVSGPTEVSMKVTCQAGVPTAAAESSTDG